MTRVVAHKPGVRHAFWPSWILGERMKISDSIGKLKKKNNVAVLQNKRWNEILGKMVLDGENHGLSEEFVLKLFKAIHQESINHQEKVIVK